MKIRFYGTVMTLVISSMFLLTALAFAAEPRIVTTEGKIMGLDLKKNMFVVNERDFFWDADSLFYDEKGNVTKGSQFRIERLKMNTLVNIEAVIVTEQRAFLIKKLHFLPKK